MWIDTFGVLQWKTTEAVAVDVATFVIYVFPARIFPIVSIIIKKEQRESFDWGMTFRFKIDFNWYISFPLFSRKWIKSNDLFPGELTIADFSFFILLATAHSVHFSLFLPIYCPFSQLLIRLAINCVVFTHVKINFRKIIKSFDVKIIIKKEIRLHWHFAETKKCNVRQQNNLLSERTRNTLKVGRCVKELSWRRTFIFSIWCQNRNEKNEK